MSLDLSIEPITGWRLWGLSTNPPGAPVLLPGGAGVGEWPARRRFEARCAGESRFGRRPLADAQHPSPSLACTCGIYASASLRDLTSSTRALPALSVVGTASMWGRTIEHERGWRSEYAYPARLTLVCAECVRSGSGKGKPAALALGVYGQRASELVAVCSDHRGIVAEGESFPLFDPQEVNGLLLDRYAVDLLPFEAVRELFERPRSPAPTAHRPTAAATSVRSIRVAVPPPQAPTPTPAPIAPTRPLGRPSIPRRVARGSAGSCRSRSAPRSSSRCASGRCSRGVDGARLRCGDVVACDGRGIAGGHAAFGRCGDPSAPRSTGERVPRLRVRLWHPARRVGRTRVVFEAIGTVRVRLVAARYGLPPRRRRDDASAQLLHLLAFL